MPDEVPDAVWRPRVRQYQEDVVRALVGTWAAAGIAVLWAVSAVTSDPTGWLLAGLWGAASVVDAARWSGQRQAVRRLLDAPVRPTVAA